MTFWQFGLTLQRRLWFSFVDWDLCCKLICPCCPTWCCSIEIVTLLSLISASSTDLKRIQTPYSIFRDFRPHKTLQRYRVPGCRVQICLQVREVPVIWQALSKAISEDQGLEAAHQYSLLFFYNWSIFSSLQEWEFWWIWQNFVTDQSCANCFTEFLIINGSLNKNKA